ncbi:MAG: ImcF-related family protein [Terriglobales bacterium]
MATLISICVLACWLVLSWFAGSWLHLAGLHLWLLRGALAFIGLAGAGFFLWWYYKIFKPNAAQDAGPDEMDPLIRDALKKIRNSVRSADLKLIPLVYVLGPSGAVKTTTIVNSGLEPELVGGQIFRDNNVVPTRSVNLWYTRKAIIAEAGGPLLTEPNRWLRLVRKFQTASLSAAARKGAQTPRAALVCVDCEAFLQPGAGENLAALARTLNARLQEVSQQLGISLPIYVIFTKLDRITFFAEYVQNFNQDEASQVVGATLPLRVASAGIYAEEETKRLTKAFDEIFYAMAEKRLDLLAREHDAQTLDGIYEFPRAWRKLRSGLVQFLADLGRPSHLQANPFLRGFYFSGARAVVVDEMSQAAPVAAAQPEAGGGATVMLNMAQLRAAAPAPASARVSGQRKVPQWVFLTRLFNDVILKDRTAIAASGFSSKVSLLRRLLIGAAALLCLAIALAFLISFIGNHSLESQVTASSVALEKVPPTSGQLPSLEGLQRLEAVRQSLEVLGNYNRDGAPWSLRWGLYTGEALYPDARQVYFSQFRKMLLLPTQQAILAQMQRLPSVPGPTDNYGFTYDSLKAYLITTSNHDKSNKAYLSPVLLDRFLAGRELDPDRAALLRKQFDFYSDELVAQNPYSPDNDAAAVARTRGYLSKFAAIERIYRSMLDEANRKNPSVRLSRNEAVLDSREVEGAFTKGGFAFMQDAISHSDRYFAGEPWVLGNQDFGTFDRPAVEQDLHNRYRSDFMDRWRSFLKAAMVLHYSNANDAVRKLTLLSSNQSPLLEVIALASTNTAVSDSDIAGVFPPVQSGVAPCATPDTGPANQGYMTGLGALTGSMGQLAPNPSDKTAVDGVRNAAVGAYNASRQLQQGFKIDKAGGVDSTTSALLDAPIKSAEAIAVPKAPDGAGLCAQFNPLANKFPFNPQSKIDATLPEMMAFFQPGSGAVWAFYQQNQAVFMRQGTEVTINPASGVKGASPRLLAFLGHALSFSDAVFGNSPTPNLRFILKGHPVEGIGTLTFDMNGQDLTGAGVPKDFIWTGGEMSQIRVTEKPGGGGYQFLAFSGTWAPFKFFAAAEKWTQSGGSTYTLDWTPKTGDQPMSFNGKPVTISYDLEMTGAPVFSKAFLAAMRCSAN